MYIEMVLDLLREKKALKEKADRLQAMLKSAREDKSKTEILKLSTGDAGIVVCHFDKRIAMEVLELVAEKVRDEIDTINETLNLIEDSIKQGFNKGKIKRPSWD